MALKPLSADMDNIQKLVIPGLDTDMDVIQKLDDEPNDVGGLSPAQLKAEFDKAGNIIKNYVNEQLLPAISDTVVEAEVRSQQEEQRAAAEEERAAAEDARTEAEKGRAEAEEQRNAAESGRVGAEDSRTQAEAGRVAAEEGRAQAEAERAAAEGQRAQAEEERDAAERARTETEEGRVLAEIGRSAAEEKRAQAEEGREGAEEERAGAEGQRVQAEKDRVNAEALRTAAEEGRAAAETAKVQAEKDRVNAEALRTAAEEERAAAETARAQAEKERAETAEKAAQALRNQPKIQEGTWWVWDSGQEAYADTEAPARGPQGPEGPAGPAGPQGPEGPEGPQAAIPLVGAEELAETLLPGGILFVTEGERKIVVRDGEGELQTMELPGARTVEFSLPAESWSVDGAGGKYPYAAQAAGTQFTAGRIPEVLLDEESEDRAVQCGLSPRAETAEGVLRLRAKQAPEGTISGTCHLLEL